MPRPPFDHFGLLSPLYERVIRPPKPAQLSALLGLRPGLQLLDVGGGTGRVAQYFRDSGVEVTLIDPSLGMLRQAQRKGCCHTCQGLAERLPFADASFARILAVDSFHHFWDHTAAAAELVRILAPGGRLVIEEPDIRRWAVKLVAWGERITLMRSRFYPPRALAVLFEAAGARVQLHETGDVNFWAVVET